MIDIKKIHHMILKNKHSTSKQIKYKFVEMVRMKNLQCTIEISQQCKTVPSLVWLKVTLLCDMNTVIVAFYHSVC